MQWVLESADGQVHQVFLYKTQASWVCAELCAYLLLGDLDSVAHAVPFLGDLLVDLGLNGCADGRTVRMVKVAAGFASKDRAKTTGQANRASHHSEEISFLLAARCPLLFVPPRAPLHTPACCCACRPVPGHLPAYCLPLHACPAPLVWAWQIRMRRFAPLKSSS